MQVLKFFSYINLNSLTNSCLLFSLRSVLSNTAQESFPIFHLAAFHVFDQSHHALLSPSLLWTKLHTPDMLWSDSSPEWYLGYVRQRALAGSTLSVKGVQGHFFSAIISHWGSHWTYSQLIAFDVVWPSFSITGFLQWSLKQLYQNHFSPLGFMFLSCQISSDWFWTLIEPKILLDLSSVICCNTSSFHITNNTD